MGLSQMFKRVDITPPIFFTNIFASIAIYYTSFPLDAEKELTFTGFINNTSRNFFLYLVVYGVPYILFYKNESFMEKAKGLKFNQKMPTGSTINREFQRTISSCFIGSAYDSLIRGGMAMGAIKTMESLSDNIGYTILLVLVIASWTDLHFFVIHRSLHHPFLYKHVHYVHHQSYNPEPWAGLSFHPVEAAIYFSAILLPMAVTMHAWHYVLLKVVLDVTPVFGHLGYGGWTGGSHFHYLHHLRKDYNYGGTALWDKICGTYLEEKWGEGSDTPSVKKGK